VKLKTTKLFFLLLILVILGVERTSAQSSSIFGAYQFCLYDCISIKINRDFTFEQRYGGLLNRQYKGQWKFIGTNKIKAESPKPTGKPQVEELYGK